MAGRDLLTEAEIWKTMQTKNGGIILIRPRDSHIAIPVFADSAAIELVNLAIHHRRSASRGIYDALLHIIPDLGGRVVCAEIDKHRAGYFSAHIVVKQEDNSFSIPLSETDTLILCARARLPLYIAESIIQELGTRESHFEENEQDANYRKMQVLRLKEQLKHCLDHEEYEKAADLRDQIERLEKT